MGKRKEKTWPYKKPKERVQVNPKSILLNYKKGKTRVLAKVLIK